MGAKFPKPQRRKIETEATGVGDFEEEILHPSKDNHHNRLAVDEKRTAIVTQTVVQKPKPDERRAEQQDAEATKVGKQHEQRRYSETYDNLKSFKLVRAQTQLNSFKIVKPLPQQSSGVNKQIKDTNELDEDATNDLPFDHQSRFNALKTSPTPSSRTIKSPNSPNHSLARLHSPNLLVEPNDQDTQVTHGVDNFEVDSLHSLSSTRPFTSSSSTTRPNFPADYAQIQATPEIPASAANKQWLKPSLEAQQSDLRLDDVDEELMEQILANDAL